VLRDSRGRDSLSGSFTEALRAYRRALALDGTDHRLYLYLGGILGSLSLESEARLPGFRQAPTGDITTAYYRLPDEYFIPLLVGEDSVVLVDSDSLATRFAGPEIDSMRSRARRAGLEVVREWLSVAPEEGTAHFLDAQLMRADRRYDEAIAAYGRAERYGIATSTPFPLFRLDLLLEASRLADAGRLADSIAASPRALDSAFVASGYSLAQPFANALYMLGRIGEASRIEQKQDSSILARAQAPEIRRFQAVNATTRPLRIAMASGRLTPDLVASVEREVQRQLDAAPEAEHRRLTPVSLSFAAAMLGDTTRARRWAANIPQSRAVATLALANAVAGNQRAAAVLYAEAVRDTMRDTRHYWGLARTAELLGRAEEALSYYTHLDSARLVLTSGPDWLFRARAYAARGALLEAKGDRAGALAAYRRFLGLWRDADPELMEERRAVERAVAELERGERR
jgi:tetratricopeptide (TPR) repeat protein